MQTPPYYFTAHEGSIFGIDVYQFPKYDAKFPLGLITATCSDDRTIRIWDISSALHARTESNAGPKNNNDEVITAELQPASSETASDGTPKPLSTIWAHASRVWKVAFIDQKDSNRSESSSLKLLSAGEDATCQLWLLEKVLQPKTGSNTSLGLTHHATLGNHAGKNIWCLHASVKSPGVAVQITTGGADGSIMLSSRDLIPSNIQEWVQEATEESQRKNGYREGPWNKAAGKNDFDKDAALLNSNTHDVRQPQKPLSDQEMTFNNSLSRSDRAKSYDWISPRLLLMTTHQGKVYIGRASPASSPSVMEIELHWMLLAAEEELKGYSATSGLPDAGFGLIAGSRGNIYAFDADSTGLEMLCKVDGKVSGLFVSMLPLATPCMLERKTSSIDSAERFIMAAPVMGSDSIDIHCLYRSKSRKLSHQHICATLSIPKGSIATSMLVVVDHDHDHLVLLGFRSGHIECYVLSYEPTRKVIPPRASPLFSPSMTIQLHTDAITSLQTIQHDRSGVRTENTAFLLSTSRDSTYTISKLSVNPTQRGIDIIHRGTPPFGPQIEGAVIDGHKQELMLYGFNSNDFVIYSEKDQRVVFRVPCGGAHRNWAYMHAKNADPNTQSLFAWTKARDLRCAALQGDRTTFIKNGGHGREIKAGAVSPVGLALHGEYFDLIATGAEDTDIRLFTVNKSDFQAQRAEFQCLTIIRKHNTGIQHLQWSANGEYLFSSGGSEGFFICRISSVPLVGVGTVFESALPPISTLPDLRITSFDVLQEQSREERFHGHASVTFRISVAISDSTARIYRYTNVGSTCSWDLLWESRYTTCCLTQMRFLDLQQMADPLAQRQTLLAAATDGHIIVWNAYDGSACGPEVTQTAREPTHYRHRVHQNSIKALAVVPLPRTSNESRSFSLLVTGGDDNALALTLLEDRQQQIITSTSGPIERVHARPAAPHDRSGLQPDISASTLIIPRAHAASITAVQLLSTNASKSHVADSHRLRFRVLSTGNDQRLKLWYVEVDAEDPSIETLDVKRMADYFTPIADIGSIDVIQSDHRSGAHSTELESKLHDDVQVNDFADVLICGVGMEVVRVPFTSSFHPRQQVNESCKLGPT